MDFGTLEIIRGGNALSITDEDRYVLEDYDGFGMPPSHRLTERGPLQHGETDLGYLLDPRLIQIALKIRSTTWEEQYTLRKQLLDYLSPTEPISLRFTEPSGIVRQIDGCCIDGPQFSKRDASGETYQKSAFRISCPDPAWYDPARKSVRVVGASGGTGFNFPMGVPWTFGGTSVSSTVTVPYLGDWMEYPEIVITGPIADAKIEHQETGDVLDFDGVVIADGDHYTIDTRYGRKTVVDAAGVNKIADLTPESDLAVWHLQPGVNTVRLSGASAGANTSIIVRWYDRYLGV